MLCMSEKAPPDPGDHPTAAAVSAAVADLERELEVIAASSFKLRSSLDALKKSVEPRRIDIEINKGTEVEENSSKKSVRLGHLNGDDSDKETEFKTNQEEPQLPSVLIKRWGRTEYTRHTRVIVSAQNLNLQKMQSQKQVVKRTLKLHGTWEEVHAKASAAGKPTYVDSTVAEIAHPEVAGPGLIYQNLSAGRLREAVVHPHSNFHLAWASFGSLLLISDALVLPVTFSWDLDVPLGVGLATTLFWACDMFLNFFTGYYVRGKLIVDYRKTVSHYLQTWFILDACMTGLDVAILILSATAPGLEGLSKARGWARMLRFMRIFRMFRIVKLGHLGAKLEVMISNVGQQFLELVVAVLKTFVILIVSVHVLGCFWFFVGRASAESENVSWMMEYEFLNTAGLDQYLLCFHWVLAQFTPAPMRVQPTNHLERAYNIFVIFFALLVVGSSIPRITQTVQQALKMGAEADMRKRQVSQYLKYNKVNMELSLRIMLFVDHKLGMQKEVALDKSLVSEKLMKELHMARRGPLLKCNPFFGLLQQAFPPVFNEICGVLKLDLHERGDDVFRAGTVSSSMFVIVAGSYTLISSSDEKTDMVTEKTEFFAELSLFSHFLHTSTLLCKHYADSFALNGIDFAHCMKDFPACGTFVYQYARYLLSQVNSGKCTADDFLPEEVREASVKFTDCYQVLNMDDSSKIDKFTVQSPNGATSNERIKQLFNGLVDPSKPMSNDELLGELESMFSEIAQDVGTHASFSLPQERLRAVAAMVSVIYLLTDRYEDFVSAQSFATKLSPESWQFIQDFVDWTGIRTDFSKIHSVLVFLAIKGLGKSERLLLQLPEDCQGPETAMVHVVNNYGNLVPSAQSLDDDTLALLIDMLLIHKDFNLGQFIQAENSPGAVKLLQEQDSRDDSAVRISLFAALGLMCGILDGAGTNACTGSKFMDENNSQLILMSIQSLQFIETHNCQVIFWSNVAKRGTLLGLPMATPSDLALVRLACLCRIQDPSSADLAHLRIVWASLDNPDRTVLVDYLLADCVNTNGLLFTYLPMCFASAKTNKAVGLSAMLFLLVELIEITRMRMTVWLDDSKQGLLMVNVQDLASFTQLVKSSSVFESCLEHIQFIRRDAMLCLSMSYMNWSRVDDADRHDIGISSSVRKILRKQQGAQKCLDQLQDETHHC
eukprot:TRINITY_DN16560_c0_g1_i1.p1 TRINITY_DN16560_c0_g1~~TRINITY_DN16560_c0_g1_i1.p1  ORF type:complete len:1171 (+),score=180.59 TRINITY_DN16560_c0_g1_i1:46-3558(+)